MLLRYGKASACALSAAVTSAIDPTKEPAEAASRWRPGNSFGSTPRFVAPIHFVAKYAPMSDKQLY
jgi:hypothetical protein